jgi:YbbR domain-containing protein
MKILSRITRDWHIKLLCLALASILWVYVNSLQEKERFMPVDLEVRNVPPGFVVAGDLPETVKVVLRGREESLALVDPRQVTADVDLRGSSRSSARRVVRVNQQQIPGGVSVKEITPRLVEVNLEKASVKTVEVLPVIEGDLPYGYSLHDVSWNRTGSGPEVPPAGCRKCARCIPGGSTSAA